MPQSLDTEGRELLRFQLSIMQQFQKCNREYVAQKEAASQTLKQAQQTHENDFQWHRTELRNLEDRIKSDVNSVDGKFQTIKLPARFRQQIPAQFYPQNVASEKIANPHQALVDLKNQLDRAEGDFNGLQTSLLLWRAGRRTLWIVIGLFILILLAVAGFFAVSLILDNTTYTLTGHSGSLSWSRDASRLATVSNNNAMYVFDKTGKFPTKTSTTASAGPIFSPDGNTIAVGTPKNGVTVFDNIGLYKYQLDTLGVIVNSLAWSRDGKTLAVGLGNNTIQLWNIENRAVLRVLSGHTGAVTALAWSPDDNTLVSGSGDTDVIFWTTQGQPSKILKGHAGTIRAVRWSPDAKTLATASEDKVIRLWNKDGSPITALTGHTDIVTALAWSPDSKTLASGSDDMTVKLWDTQGNLKSEFNAGFKIKGLGWSPTGKTIVTSAENGGVQFWDIDGTLVSSPT